MDKDRIVTPTKPRKARGKYNMKSAPKNVASKDADFGSSPPSSQSGSSKETKKEVKCEPRIKKQYDTIDMAATEIVIHVDEDVKPF